MDSALAEEQEEESGESNESSKFHQDPEHDVETMLMLEDMDLLTPIQKPTLLAIAVLLAITVVGFTVQIEATAYYQDVLDWPKPVCSLYLTDSSLILPWFLYQTIYRPRVSKRREPWLRTQINEIAALAAATDAYRDDPPTVRDHSSAKTSPIGYMLRTMAIETVILTISGIAWFVALNWTTPSDLTVIYNCSAFFAAAFSVPLLHQQLTRNVVIAVSLSIAGTLLIAYGGGNSADAKTPTSEIGTSRVLGNLVAMVGACTYGLYCVLFKKWTTSTQQGDLRSSLRMTFAASALTGLYTLIFLWTILPVLHFTGLETLSLPSPLVLFYLLISITMGFISITSILVLTAWTNPVFSSVASVLCVFFVAIADWVLFGVLPTVATYVGGVLIFFAFGLLSWDESAK